MIPQKQQVGKTMKTNIMKAVMSGREGYKCCGCASYFSSLYYSAQARREKETPNQPLSNFAVPDRDSLSHVCWLLRYGSCRIEIECTLSSNTLLPPRGEISIV